MPLSTLRKFKIRTLDTAGLRAEAEALAAKAHDFSPDIILGIRTGGYHVALMMERSFPNAIFLPITCRRPGSASKQVSRIKGIISRLPHIITGTLRIAEHVILTQLRPPRKKKFTPDPTEMSLIQGMLLERKDMANILIVDDSVDSGATLMAVLEAIQAVAGPATQIKTAAITVTTEAPLIEPDFSLHRFVLYRFPWSIDAKK